MRQANTFFVEDRYPGYGNFRDYRRRVAAETSAFTRCLRCFLRGKDDEETLRVELKQLVRLAPRRSNLGRTFASSSSSSEASRQQ